MTKPSRAEIKKMYISLILQDSKTQQESELSCNVALVAIGRKPYIEGLGLEKLGIELT